MDYYLLHPVAVHFPIALLLTGALFEALALSGSPREWLTPAATWLLWLGTLGALAAAGLGLLAERTAPHVPPAWETLAEHKELGLWTGGLFAGLSAWRKFAGLRGRKIFLLAWLAAAGVLIAAAYHGGEVVYRFGMGVVRPE